ncbi:hypothetical protein ABIC15_002244 [Exiguobacterium sp. PvP048]|uniref:hypothetical protein n=1 Tax=unclassified Exiguobacterium TaxID=2644629 RepID=UPI003394A98E
MKKITKILSAPLLLSTSLVLVGPKYTQALSGNEGIYFYHAPAASPVYKSKSYGAWEVESKTMHGPQKMIVSEKVKTNWSVTGAGEISRGSIKGSLEGFFGKDKTITVNSEKYIPKGKKGTFKTRIVYKNYTQKYNQWFTTDGHRSKTGKTKTIKIKKKYNVEGKISITK